MRTGRAIRRDPPESPEFTWTEEPYPLERRGPSMKSSTHLIGTRLISGAACGA